VPRYRTALAALAALTVLAGAAPAAADRASSGPWKVDAASGSSAAGPTPCAVTSTVEHAGTARVLVTYYNAAGEPAPYPSATLKAADVVNTVTVSLPRVFGPAGSGNGVTAAVALQAPSGNSWVTKVSWPTRLGPFSC
jgi:hypothetical protein